MFPLGRLPHLALRSLRRDPSALQRGRFVFLGLGLLSLGATAVIILAGQGPGLLPRPLASVSALALGASWVLATRRGRFGLWQDPLEWTALAVLALTVGAERATGLFFGGLFLRALFLAAPRLAVSTLAYVATWTATSAATSESAQAFATLPRGGALLVTAAGMHLLGQTLRRYEQAMARERELVGELERGRGEERFRSLVHASSDMILVLDPQGRIVFQSPSAERILGCGPDALLGRPLRSLLAPDDDGPLARDGLLALAGRGAFEWRARREDDAAVVELEALLTDLRDEPTVAGLVITSRDVGERRAFERMLAYQAFHDELTGLPNRALLLERLRQVEGPAAVLRLDLDEYRMVNDSLGHAAGEELLLGVADRLRPLLGSGELLARLGGDEFAVLADGRRQDAGGLAERIVGALERPFVLQGTEVRTGARIGIAAGTGEPEALLRQADAALHAAKTRDGARVAVFEEAMHTAALARLALRADLQRALETDELVLHYQPVVDLEHGRVVGVEALVRWRHPERGLVAPGAFIPLSEETGLVVPLGRWVLAEACAQVRAWHRALPGTAPLRLSVNVSPRQLLDPGIVEDVAAALRASGLDPAHLVLEITETVLAQNAELAIERLEALRRLGVGIAVDDFGTGYSSLSYLQRFPLDVLKIDRSFVAGVEGGEGGATFAQVILDLAGALGLRVVAEGIEREAQHLALRERGCEFGQGFLFSRPLEPGALLALVERQRRAAAPAR